MQDLEQARQAVQQLLPQCVVIDTAHTALNNDALQALAQHWNLQDIPLIACPLPEEDLLRQQLTVNGYLVKPVSTQNVQDALNRIPAEIERILVVDDNHDFVQMLPPTTRKRIWRSSNITNWTRSSSTCNCQI